jgi:hypothetical protein
MSYANSQGCRGSHPFPCTWGCDFEPEEWEIKQNAELRLIEKFLNELAIALGLLPEPVKLPEDPDVPF